MFERYFLLTANGTTVRREILAGFTTFLTMSAILFVNPDILAQAGIDHGSAFVATCVAAAVGSLIMGLLANYPIGQAPGMGINAFFTFGLVKGLGLSWQLALGCVFVSGCLFMLVSSLRIREWFVNAFPPSLKHSIAAGVGLFVALLGLSSAGIVTGNPDTLVAIGAIGTPQALLAMAGFVLMVVLDRLGVRGAILIGILTVTAVSVILGLTPYGGLFSTPPSLAPTWLQADIGGALQTATLGIVLSLFLMDLFETSGTLIAIGERGGFLDRDGKLPRLKQAMLADSTAITIGALLGTSSTTSYLESTTGIAAGGRTGLTAVVIAALFMLALWFAPLAAMIPAHATAPALLFVAVLMLRSLTHIDWDDMSESAPAIACVTTMAYTFSISDGIAFGVIGYVLIKTLSGQWRQVSLPIAAVAVLFVLRFCID